MPLVRALCLILLALPLAGPAAAGDMTFFIKNGQPRAVVVEMHSRQSDKVWPGGDRIYQLDAGTRKSVVISCTEGETICYGAWVYGDDRQSFGAGPDRDRSCSDCCSICVDKTTTTIDFAR